jgi:hypothetical protein
MPLQRFHAANLGNIRSFTSPSASIPHPFILTLPYQAPTWVLSMCTWSPCSLIPVQWASAIWDTREARPTPPPKESGVSYVVQIRRRCSFIRTRLAYPSSLCEAIHPAKAVVQVIRSWERLVWRLASSCRPFGLYNPHGVLSCSSRLSGAVTILILSFCPLHPMRLIFDFSTAHFIDVPSLAYRQRLHFLSR